MITQQTGGFVSVVDAQLAARAVAIGVDRRLRHAELAGDLLGAQMLVHEAKTFALALGKQLDRISCDDRTRSHGASVKPDIRHFVYFAESRSALRHGGARTPTAATVCLTVF